MHTQESYLNIQDPNLFNSVQYINIIVQKKTSKKRKKYKVLRYSRQNPQTISKGEQTAVKQTSMPEIKTHIKMKVRSKISDASLRKSLNSFHTNFDSNFDTAHRNPIPTGNPFHNQTRLKIYRCQLASKEESCCCSCNSDAMFEVMKSLYDCYKKKDCDNCNCILCGHLPREERLLGETRKSIVRSTVAVGEEIVSPREKKKIKSKKAIKDMVGKTTAEKEKVLRDLVKSRATLPEPKTASEKDLIKKIKTEYGLPQEPKTSMEKVKMKKAEAAGVITPLSGKTPWQKEKILKGQAEMGVPLPEGRTPSEKALIEKVKATTKVKIPSEKWRKAKEAGLLTPLEDKTPEQKETILKGLAMQGLPLPEGQTPSGKEMIKKIRIEVGLPPEPKTLSLKEKYKKATDAGLMVPLEGKSPSQKEKILQSQADRGIPLPEGRTTSEKALISKVKAATRPPSEGAAVLRKMEKAKAAELLTPLEGKSSEHKEKILKGRVMAGIPLPEPKTASEKKIHDKVRTDLGLPPEPKTSSHKQKYQEALAAGHIEPLEGKSPSQKEKILRAQHEMGIPLPEGRTTSEKALIEQIKSKRKKTKSRGITVGRPAMSAVKRQKLDEKTAKVVKEGKGPADECICDMLTPESERERIYKAKTEPSITTEKIRKAKTAGLFTPLQGKTPEEKERVLTGLAKSGLPLPKGKTPSEKALIHKVKTAAGIPEKSESQKLRKAKETGLLTPLEGKPLSHKEKILRGRAAAGLPLPSGKTPSEKHLLKKIKADTGYVTPTPSEKMARAKAAGLLTPLEGKTASVKEKIVQQRLQAGLPPPEGKTPSEKVMIKKVAAATARPSKGRIPSEKLKKAKAAGLLTPLQGKTPEHKEKVLKGLVKAGLPLPEPKTTSEKELINKVRQETGLPPEPKTAPLREKYLKAHATGIMTPLEGKSPSQKEQVIQNLQDAGIPLPEGRTVSEKAMIQRVKAGIVSIPSEKLRTAKAAGLLTPLEGKSPEHKEKILKGLVKAGVPLPDAKTSSEKELMMKVRKDMGLPPHPKTLSVKERLQKAQAAGLVTPLEGKTPSHKERIIKKLAQAKVQLPEGRTPSEKAMISKIKAEKKSASKVRIPSEKIRKAKAAGLLTPLEGKTAEEKEKIMKGLAMEGIPLPEPKTSSEKVLMKKIRTDIGLPPEPKTLSERRKFEKAMADGLIAPLEGKTRSEKAKILKTHAEMGMPLPEGRTTSEKALVSKIKTQARVPSKVRIPSEKLRKAKEAGLLTPLKGKKPEEKERILKGLAMHGLPIPEPKTSSHKKLVEKVRVDLGLPPEPKSPSERQKHEKAVAAGIIKPLEGMTHSEKIKTLKAQADMGLTLPEGRSSSEKELIAQVKAEAMARPPSEKIRKAQAAGLVSPLEGKTPQQKEIILTNLAEKGMPLPEGKTSSENALIDKVRKEMGLPPEPQTISTRERMRRAHDAGLVIPLEGKTPSHKEKILKDLAEAGVPLPHGRTSSEKALISKIQATTPKKPRRSIRPPLSPKEAQKLNEKTAKIMKEGTGPVDECICNILTPESEKISAEPTKTMSDKVRQAKAVGLMTPLEGKTPEHKEKIMRDLAMQGLPIPEAKTASDKKLAAKVRADIGLPMEPRTASEKMRHTDAHAAGVIVPLEGKTQSEKEKIIQSYIEKGVSLPEGRTSSEKALIAKVKSQASRPKVRIPSEKMRQVKAAGLITPLEGKTPEEKENIIKGLAMAGVPLPKAKTASEKKVIEKVHLELGLPPPPKTLSEQKRYDEAVATGVVVPLEGKTPSEKAKALRAQAKMGLSLPQGRTTSEIALISKVKAETREPTKVRIPSEKIREAKAAGLLTPLEGKPTEEKVKILKGLTMAGIPLPEAKTLSEKRLMDKVRTDLGLPPEPKTPREQIKYREAIASGAVVPLEGKSSSEKAKILRDQAELGLPLPEGRTASEKSLIAKVKKEVEPKITRGPAGLHPDDVKKLDEKTAKVMKEGKGPADECICNILTPPSERISKKVPPKLPPKISSEIIRKAKAAGLLTPLEGKTASHKEKIIKGLAMHGMQIPEAKTASEQKLVEKVRIDLGLPPEPKTLSEKQKYSEAHATGKIVPLEGKTRSVKEKTLRAQAQMGLPLPEGRTPSEKALISKVKVETRAKIPTKVRIPSEKIRKAKTAGLLTPLTGKSFKEKEKIMKGLAMQGIPLPEAKTLSEKKLSEKVRLDLGLPPEPRTSIERKRYEKAIASGVIVPLEGKTASEKEKTLRAQIHLGMPMPEGRSASERAIILKIKTESQRAPSEKIRKAKAAGFITPLQGKTRSEKEKIVRGLAEMGLPMPESKTASERAMIHKIRVEMGIPPPAKTPSEKERIRDAKAEGLFTPLAGKSAAHKERILKGLAEAGLPLPEGQTMSEKELVKKVKTAAGLPQQPIYSERRAAIRSKSKKVGISSMTRATKGIGVGKMDKELAKAGIIQEFEDIEKTTTCDRGCGCDRKKIRFKHSYVKIRVTSPDISSLCPCPEECIPGVKGGVFTDSEGIKVTIGSAIGVPLFCKELAANKITPETNASPHRVEYLYKCATMFTSSSDESLNNYHTLCKFEEKLPSRVDVHKAELSCSTQDLASSPSFEITNTISKSLDSVPVSCYSLIKSYSRRSSDTMLIMKSETSLSFITNSNSSNTISVVSFVDSSYTTSSHQCISYSSSENSGCISAFEESECDTDFYSNNIAVASKEYLTKPSYKSQNKNETKISETKIDYMNGDQNSMTSHVEETGPIILLDEVTSDHDIITMVDDLLSSKEFSVASSVYIVVTNSEDYLSTDSQNSTVHLQISDTSSKTSSPFQSSSRVSSIACALKLSRKAKSNFAEKISPYPKPRLHIISNRSQMFAAERRKANEELQKKLCQVVTTDKTEESEHKYNAISTDTTQDRPCCCPPNNLSIPPNFNQSETQCVANVMSELIAPMIQLGVNRDLGINACPVPETTMSTQSSFSKNNLAPRVTPVRICQVPSPAAYETCQLPVQSVNKCPDHKNQPQNSCVKPLACGNPVTQKKDASLKKNVDTSTQDRYPKPIMLDSKMGKKNEKKVTLVPPSLPGLGSRSVGCQCCLHGGCREGPSVQFYGVGAIDKETTETLKPVDALLQDHCVCRNKPGENAKKKKIVCKCPEPEPEPDYIAYEDYEFTQEDMWKMRSSLTQATSGFKLVMNKKLAESEMSFEEALDYYASLNPGLLCTELQKCEGKSPEIKYLGEKCDCEERAKSKYKLCECPKEELVVPEVKEEPWKGLKFAIGGKGSASKGLAGICCFDMQQDSRTFIKIKIKAIRQNNRLKEKF